MEYVIEYCEDLNSVIARTEGPIILNGILEMIDDVVSVLSARPGVNLISDHTDSPADLLSVDDIWKISIDCMKLSEHLEGKRLAVVLKRDVDYGIGRMWESFTEAKVPFDIQLFRTSEDASNWIAEVLPDVVL